MAVLNDIIIADTIPLRSRGKWEAFLLIGSITASFVGPVVAGALLASNLWRLHFYVYIAFIVFFIIPLVWRVKMPKAKGSLIEKIKGIDYIGNVILIVCCVSTMIGFNWAGSKYAWDSPLIVSMLCIALASLVVFVLYEKYYAKNPIIPLRCFNIRNVSCVYLIDIVFNASAGYAYLNIAFYQISLDLSPATAGLVANTPHSIVATLSAIVVAFLIQYTGRYRRFIFLTAIFNASGLIMRLFISRETSLALICASHAVNAGGVGMLHLSSILAIQSSVEHKDIAIVTTLYSFFKSLSRTVGICFMSAIFNSVISSKLRANLPADVDHNIIRQTLQSIDKIKALNPPIRNAVANSYLETMRLMYSISLCMVVFACFFMIGLRRYKLSEKVGAKPELDETKIDRLINRYIFREKPQSLPKN
ncbi:uncharacterized protein VTP21DRAFT_9078 [Calcarisporiella thermophila]|uniref:uncharacterized protein n=1 Tax=Calcarisporiella thermophila TaxID=911321 RepID=UPI0037423F5D